MKAKIIILMIAVCGICFAAGFYANSGSSGISRHTFMQRCEDGALHANELTTQYCEAFWNGVFER